MKIHGIWEGTETEEERLLSCGFRKRDGAYVYTCPVMAGEFLLTLMIDGNGWADYSVTETDSGEPYALAKVKGAAGSFVSSVRDACGAALAEIRKKLDGDTGGEETARRIASRIQALYGASPEHLWEKSPENMAFRHKENRKWFALLLPVGWEKLDKTRSGDVWAIDLRAPAEKVAALVGRPGYYPGYHMNKKYWYAAALSGVLTDEEILERIEESFQVTG